MELKKIRQRFVILVSTNETHYGPSLPQLKSEQNIKATSREIWKVNKSKQTAEGIKSWRNLWGRWNRTCGLSLFGLFLKKNSHFPEYFKTQCPYNIQNVQYTIQKLDDIEYVVCQICCQGRLKRNNTRGKEVWTTAEYSFFSNMHGTFNQNIFRAIK